jgi:hypothetical protein
MFAAPQTSIQTVNLYRLDANKLVNQFCREVGREVLSGPCEADYFGDAPYEVLLVEAAHWFLRSHERWSKSHIKRTALALHHELERFVLAEMIDGYGQNRGEPLLRALQKNRPRPATKTKKAGKKNKRKPYRKSLKMQELRRLIEYFRGRPDEFSHWIAGYLLIASRIGWRPGEILILRREGKFLRAEAEKHSNGRGLTDTCEVDISAYPERLMVWLDQWIAGIERWEEKYDGLGRVQSNINGRLRTACEALGIKRVATYTLRQWAISCMKKSGFSQSEIAVIVNHASNRTATEKYGKGRGGIKRAKKMLRCQEERLILVRDKARRFKKQLGPSAAPTP